MAIPKKTSNFLEKSGLKFEEVSHRKVYTAIDKARTLKIGESSVAKTVILKADRIPFIALIPSDRIIDIVKLQKIVEKLLDKKIKKLSFASEKWIKENLKGMKEGVIPPFGPIWGLPVVVDKKLLEGRKIVLNSGSHIESIVVTPTVFKKLIPDMNEVLFTKKRAKKK